MEEFYNLEEELNANKVATYLYMLEVEKLEQLLNDANPSEYEKIIEELSQRIAEPVKVRKIKYNELIYAGKYKIADNFVGGTKKFIIDLLNGKKCSELMLIN